MPEIPVARAVEEDRYVKEVNYGEGVNPVQKAKQELLIVQEVDRLPISNKSNPLNLEVVVVDLPAIGQENLVKDRPAAELEVLYPGQVIG